MIESEFDVLLYRGESDMLDYKSIPYNFIGASDHDKAELLKDCLAFANSWRREIGYILLGVEKQTGKPARVVGIQNSDHFDDASLQQFINAKTNIPVSLLYEEIEYKGLSVGLIRFEYPQQRPVYLNKNYSRLNKNAVYIRRGSSTDECKPSEIARMGTADNLSNQLDFEINFVDRETNDNLGRSLDTCSVILERPEWVDAPEPRAHGLIEFRPMSVLGNRERTKLEKFEAVSDIARYSSFALQITNSGTMTAKDIEISLKIDDHDGMEFTDKWNPPNKKYKDSLLAVTQFNPHIDARVDKTADGWHIQLHCKKLHAKQKYIFDSLFVTVDKSLVIPMKASIFAHDLPDPECFEMSITIRPELREYSADLPKLLHL